MNKYLCNFREYPVNDNYCDLVLNEHHIFHVIKKAITEYADRLKNNNMPITTYSRKNKTQVFNLPVNFDIETTNIKENKSALCYIWQVSIYETVFYGRYIEEFEKFINIFDLAITSLYQGIKGRNRSKPCIIIYVHNLSFEYQFIRKYFRIEKNSVLCYDKRNIITFDLSHNRDVIFSFRCSYQLTRKPLSKLNNSRNVVKLSPIDYSLIRSPLTKLTSNELDYALYDVLVMSYFFDDYLILKHTNLSDIPLTLTGNARDYFKETCGFKLGKNDVVPDDVLEYRKVLNNCKLNNFLDLQLARYSFMGGFTHAGISAYNDVHENVYHYDLTSSYPTVLLSEKYPVESFSRNNSKINALFRADKSDFIKKITSIPVSFLRDKIGTGYLIGVTLNNVMLKKGKNECIISHSKILNNSSKNNPAIINQIDNGRIVSGTNIELFITDVDYQLIREFYDFTPVIKDILFADFDYLPEVFCKTVLDLYADKTTLKDVKGSEYEYQLKKMILNSIYGLTVTDPIPDDFIYNNDTQELTEKLFNDDEIQEKLDTYNSTKDKPNKINYYYWGVYCTAYGRNNLITMINKLGRDYLYADTDSVFFTGKDNIKYINEYNIEIVHKLKNNPHVSENKIAPKDINGKYHILGQWTKETECKYFVTIGAKRYLEIYNTGFKFTCAGIKPEKLKAFYNELWINHVRDNHIIFDGYTDYKNSKFIYIAESFNDVFNGENYLIEKTGKQTSFFNDDNVTGVITDYQGNNFEYNIKSGLFLNDATFNLTTFDLSDGITQIIDQYRIFSKAGIIDDEIL